MLKKDFKSDENVLKFQDSAVLRECRDIWKDWRDLDLEVKSVKENRIRLIEDRRRVLNFSRDIQCLFVLKQMVKLIYEEELDHFSQPTSANPLYEEIKHWFSEGSTSDESDETNPTLIRPFVHKWRQHYSSCAFESYPPLER